MAKKRKLLSLSEEDILLLKALQGEFDEDATGIDVTESNVVSMALRLVEAEGGAVKAFNKLKEGSDKKKAAR